MKAYCVRCGWTRVVNAEGVCRECTEYAMLSTSPFPPDPRLPGTDAWPPPRWGNLQDLRARADEYAALVQGMRDSLQAWEGEEASVQAEHAALIAELRRILAKVDAAGGRT